MIFTDDHECQLLITDDIHEFSETYQRLDVFIDKTELEPLDVQQTDTYLEQFSRVSSDDSLKRMGHVWQK